MNLKKLARPKNLLLQAVHRNFSLASPEPPKKYNGNSRKYNTSIREPSATAAMNKSHADESDVGIFCYISPELPGFRGILKQRYSDFVVNEVDLDGNVVHLTSLEAPPEIAEDKEVKISDQPDKSYVLEIESFKDLAGDSDADRLKTFIEQIGSGSVVDTESIVLSPSSDKLHRTAVHNFFKERLKFLVTDTVDGIDDSSKCIRVRLKLGKSNGKGRNSKKRKDRNDKPYDRRGSDSWPEHLGKFLMFHLYKENKDTQEALGIIGKMIGVQPRSFGFAGTKDKRSVSTQRVTVFKQRASRLAALNERLIGIKIGDFCHVNGGLLLGQLKGNHFTITLRGVVADPEDIIKASAEALGEHGFINYFGLQRFGSGSVPTHLIGAALLRGEWETAVKMILDPRLGENDAITKARDFFKESGDIEGTLKQLPRHMVAERAILQCLKKCPGNYLQALQAIPRTLRMMYVHSYQSYLWNHAASMRVQKYGCNQVMVGDLVYCKDQCTEQQSRIAATQVDDDILREAHDNDISEPDLPEEGSLSVKAVSKEDIAGGIYTTDDVVLPLPGSRVIYPSNDIGNVYHDLAKKDAICLTESVHGVKEFSVTSMTGAYRQVFQKPKDFEWELLTYTDGNIPLAETDLDRIAKSIPEIKVSGKDSLNGKKDEIFRIGGEMVSGESELDSKLSADNGEAETEVQIKESTGGCNSMESQIALKLSFTLPASCYATMAIRELLKTSTSVAFHKALNG